MPLPFHAAPRRLTPRPVLPARLALWLTSACLSLGAQAAGAQSLVEVYEAARGYDASFLAARAQAEASTFAAAQSQALLRPSAGLSAGANTAEIDSENAGRGSSSSRSLAVSARQPLYDRASARSIDQAERQVEITQAALQLTEQDLLLRVSQAYFDVLAAEDTLAFARASKAAITEQLASARRNFEVGTATITDTREAQARFDLATAQEIAGANQLATAQAALDQLVGRAQVKPSPLLQPVRLPPLDGSVDDWVGPSDQGHPAVRQAELALEIARLETQKANAGHLPTVDLVGSVGTSNGSGSFSTSRGSQHRASVGVELNLPLFAGFAVQNRVQETLRLEERSRNELDGTRRSVRLGTRQAWLGVQSGAAQVQALEAAESSSLLALEATQTGYRVGVRVNLDVLNAQTQLFQTRRDLARARYDVLVGHLALRQAAGRLTPDDLRPIDALLVR